MFAVNLLVGLNQGCILNLIEFGYVEADKKWESVLVLWCGGDGGLWFLRKIRPTKLSVELSWVWLFV